MTTETKSTENSSEVQIKKILVPIDGSEYSLKAAKYAIKIAKDENAQLLCIHIITPPHTLWLFLLNTYNGQIPH
ncbi:MAG TPA: universal stress protein [Nitrososphaeraceae archaeon]